MLVRGVILVALLGLVLLVMPDRRPGRSSGQGVSLADLIAGGGTEGRPPRPARTDGDGRVLRFSMALGFGWSAPPTPAGKDLFIGASAVRDAGLPGLRDGDRIEYVRAASPAVCGRCGRGC